MLGLLFWTSSRYLVFFLYLTLKSEEVQNAIPISFLSNSRGHKFSEFACILKDHNYSLHIIHYEFGILWK